MTQTALFQLPLWIYRRSTGQILSLISGKATDAVETTGEVEGESDETESDEAVAKAKTSAGPVGTARRRAKRNGKAR